MAIADWFRKRSRGRPTVEVALPPLETVLTATVPRLESAVVEGDLLRARLADAYRDGQLEPPLPETFDARTARLDKEGWRRLALAVSALDHPPLRAALPGLVQNGDTTRQMEVAFIGLSQATSLLTMELLRQGPLRIEEFARHLLARLGAQVVGETVAQSRERLERLDYECLLAEAERAKESAEVRMDYLRKLQEEKDRRRPRRGKW